MKQPFIKKPIFFLTLAVIAVCAIFYKYLSFSHLFIFGDVGSDTLSLFYPGYLDEARIWWNEGLPFWSFAKGMGQSSWSNNILDPFHMSLMAMGESSLAYGIGWVNLAKIVAVTFITYHLFSLQQIDRKAATLGAILATFLGYLIVGSTWYGHATNIFFMLLFLLGIELLITRNQWWPLAYAAAMLLGAPLFFMLEFSIIYGLMRFSISEGLDLDKIKLFMGRLWKPILLGCVLIAPFIGNTINKFLNSPRVSGEASYVEELSSQSIFAINDTGHLASIFARFLSNDLLGGPKTFTGWNNYLEAPLFYAGLLTLLLFPQLFSFIKKKQKFVFGAILILYTLVLFFPYFRTAFYLFMGDYYKGALSLFIPFTLLYMAVIAFHFIIREKRISIPVLGITYISLCLGLYLLPSFSELITVSTSEQWKVFGFLTGATLLLGGLHFLKYPRWMVNLILIFSILEGATFSYAALNDRSAMPVKVFQSKRYYNDYTVEALDFLNRSDLSFFRLEKLYGSYLKLGLNDSQAQNFYDTKSYRSHNHNNYIKFLKGLKIFDATDEYATRWIGGLKNAYDILPLLQSKYMLSEPEGDQPDILYYQKVNSNGGINIFKGRHEFPFGYPLYNYALSSDVDKYGYFRVVDGMYQAAIIDEEQVDDFSSLSNLSANRFSSDIKLDSYAAAAKGKGLTIDRFSNSHLHGNATLDKLAAILIPIPYDEGWKATVNGKKAPLHKIHYGLTGLILPQGSHEVSLSYRPPFLWMGIILFILGLIGMFWLYKKQPKNESAILSAIIGKKMTTTIEEKTSISEPDKKPLKKVKKKRGSKK